jgi:hypothetical protein
MTFAHIGKPAKPPSREAGVWRFEFSGAHHDPFDQWQDVALSTRSREFDSPKGRQSRQGVAQSGRAPASDAGGRRIEGRYPDQFARLAIGKAVSSHGFDPGRSPTDRGLRRRVAQQDRALVSEARGRRIEACRGDQSERNRRWRRARYENGEHGNMWGS